MSEYAQEVAEAFAQARNCYEETERWLAGGEAAALTHAELALIIRAPSRAGGDAVT